MDKLSVLVFLFIFNGISALKLLAPNPTNEVLVEGEPLQISCSYADSSGYPTVKYQRRYDDISYEDLRTNERVYVTNSTRNTSEGYVTIAVLHFTSVKTEDDTDIHHWQCKGSYAAATDMHGFALSIIAKADLPKATIGGGGAIQHGATVTLTCNVTDGKSYAAPLKGLWWIRDGKALKNATTNTIPPLVIVNATGSNGGEYRCTGVFHMRALAEFPKQMVLNKTMLYVKLKISEGTTNVKGNEAGNVTMECPADGYPLNVTWMRLNKDKQEVNFVNNRYVVTKACPSCRSRLTISNLLPSDQGVYICKAAGFESTGKHNFVLSFSSVEPTIPPSIESSAVITGFQSFWIVLVGLVALLLA